MLLFMIRGVDRPPASHEFRTSPYADLSVGCKSRRTPGHQHGVGYINKLHALILEKFALSPVDQRGWIDTYGGSVTLELWMVGV